MQAVVEVLHGKRHVGGYAEHRFSPRWPDQGIVDKINVPKAHLGVVHGQPQSLLANAQAGLGANALDMRPASLDGFLHEPDFVGGPRSRLILMNCHRCRQAAVLDKRAADDGADAKRLEHFAAVTWAKFRDNIAYYERSSQVQVGEHARTKQV